jgi:cell division protein FtsA
MVLRHIRRSKTHSDSEVIAALDVGSSKVCCAIAKAESPDQFRVIGVGHQISKGIRNGNVIDMQDAELSILNAVHLAEQMAKETIRDVYVNVPICHSRKLMVELPISGNCVDSADVRRLMTLARDVEQPKGLETVHTIPTSYDIDGRRGIRDPRGMYGETLGVEIHTVHSPVSNIRNISTCIARCHLEARSFVATPFASGLSSLIEDEMDLGVAVVDMGAGMTTIGVFYEGHLLHTDSLPIGGHHVTSDIARVLSTPVAQAERLKTLHGSALTVTSDDREIVKVPQIGESDEQTANQIAKGDLVRIIRPRIEETFEMVNMRLSALGGTKRICNRIVLVGGASQLSGVQDVAGAILDRPVRIGRPLQQQHILHDSLKGPPFATCVGLLNYALMEQSETIIALQNQRTPTSMVGKVGRWLKDNI